MFMDITKKVCEQQRLKPKSSAIADYMEFRDHVNRPRYAPIENLSFYFTH